MTRGLQVYGPLISQQTQSSHPLVPHTLPLRLATARHSGNAEHKNEKKLRALLRWCLS